MIKRVTSSVWSHVGFLIVLKEFDRVLILESVKGFGVRIMPLSNYLERYDGESPYQGKVVLAKYDAAKNFDLENAVNWGLEQIPSSYDTDGLVSGALKIAVGSGHRSNDDEWDCSELVGGIFERGNYAAPYDKRGFICPESIWRDKSINLLARIL